MTRSGLAPPPSVRYSPPSRSAGRGTRSRRRGSTGSRPRSSRWSPGGPLPVVPEPDGAIIIGGVTLSVGSGGLHSCDHPALYRYGERQLYEADVVSYYPI